MKRASARSGHRIMAKKATIGSKHAIGGAVRQAAFDILAAARAALDNSARSDAVKIHDYRKAMKRWRAFLRLLESKIPAESKRLRRQARQLARELAGPRDAQSALDALHDIIKNAHPRSSSFLRVAARIEAHLQTDRKKQEASRLNDDLRARLIAGLNTATASVERWPLKSMRFEEILQQIAKTYRRARRATPKSWERAPPREVHRLRQRVIDHRYQMEILEPLWPRMGRTWIREAQRLREQLGKYQDLTVLAGLTAPRSSLARWRTPLLRRIERRQHEHLALAKRTALRMFAEPSKAFQRRFEALWKAGGGKIAQR